MSHIYLTLVSDVTKKYIGNVGNQFTMKPNLRLHGTGWKVSIATAILPKMSLFKSLQNADVNLMELWSKTKKQGQSDAYQKGYFKSTDLRSWEQANTCHEGIDFFNTVKHRIEETAHASLDDGFQFGDWHSYEWNKEGVQPELVLTHSAKANTCYIYKPFAEALGWLNSTSHQADFAGPNLIHSYPNHTKGASSLLNNKPTNILGNWLWLSMLSDWRFINLNESFENALNLHPRNLQVTANVKANSVTVTQPLGYVHYAPKGRQQYVFTPWQENFYEVQDNEWEEVEITLKEIGGTKVEFQTDSQCVIQLHFTKQ